MKLARIGILIYSMLSLAVFVLGLCVVIGWVVDNHFLIQMSEGYAQMQFNTALCFLFIGVGLLLYEKIKYISALFGFFVCCLVVLTGLQYVLQVNVGIDTLFVNYMTADESTHPGRMGLGTIFCFFLSGIALFIHAFIPDRVFSTRMVFMLSLIITVMGLIALFGYAFGVYQVHSWGNLSRMALHTAFGFVLIGLSLILHCLVFGLLKAKKQDLYLPFLIFVTGIIISVVLWQAFQEHQEESLKQKILFEGTLLSDQISESIFRDVTSIQRLFIRIDNKRYGSNNDLKNDLIYYISQINSLDAIIVRYNNESIIETMPSLEDINPNTISPICLAADRNPLLAADHLFLTVIPNHVCIVDVHEDNMAVFDSHDLIVSVMSPNVLEHYLFSVTANDMTLYESEGIDSIVRDEYAVDIPIKFMGLEWNLSIYPGKQYVGRSQNWLPFVFLCFSVSVTFMMAFLVYLWRLTSKTNIAIVKAIKIKDETQKLLSTVVQNSPDSIFIINREGKIIFANASASHLWGYTESEMKTLSIESLMPERFREIHKAHREHYMQDPHVLKMGEHKELFMQNRFGKEIPIESVLVPILIEDDIHILCTVVDIYDRKVAQEAMEKYTDDLKRSNEALDDFAYIASHDLKEPLRGISNFSTFLLEDYEDKLDEDGVNKLKTLNKLAHRMEGLINSLLEFSRLGRQELNCVETNVNTLVQSQCEMLEHSIKEKHGHVTIVSPLPQLVCDPIRLGQVFANLISNALKYNLSEEKTITIDYTETPEEVIFSVKDNGIGVPVDQQDSMFKIFKRLHGKDEYGGGTGAGLTIVKKIVEKHGGQIWVDSEIGKGTTFYFSISKHVNNKDGHDEQNEDERDSNR